MLKGISYNANRTPANRKINKLAKKVARRGGLTRKAMLKAIKKK